MSPSYRSLTSKPVTVLVKSMLFVSMVLCIHIPSVSFAQSQYTEVWYGTDDDHLPQQSIKGIIKDAYGYLWLFTEGGIVRYDGLDFKVLDDSDTGKPEYNRTRLYYFSKISQDSIFGCFNEKEIFVISNRKVTRIQNFIQDIPHLNDPFLYAHTLGRTAFLSTEVRDNNYFFETDNGNYLILYDNLIRYYNANHEMTAEISFDRENFLHFFKIDGQVFLTDKKGDVWLVPEQNKTLEKADSHFSNEGSFIVNWPMNQAFYYLNQQLYLLSYKNGQIQKQLVLDGYSFEKSFINTIYFDPPTQNIYLGSVSRGLGVISPIQIHNHQSPSDNKVFYAQALLEDNKILTSQGEVLDLQGNITHTYDLLPFSDKYNLIVENNRKIWTKNNHQLYYLSLESGNPNVSVINKWTFEQRVSHLYRDKSGTLWISTAFGKKGSLYKMVGGAPELVSKGAFEITCFLETKSAFLLGSNNGLYILDPVSGILEKLEGMDDILVRSIYEDRNGEIWINTYSNGMFHYHAGKFTSLPTDPMGYLRTSHCILEDSDGYFWISSNKGLFHVKRSHLEKYIKGEIEHVYYHHFNKTYGLRNTEFNGGCVPCGIFLKDQDILSFPSMDGMVIFSPKKLQPRFPKEKIYFDKIQVDNRQLPIEDTLILDKTFSRLSIDVSVPFFGNSKNLILEYTLTPGSNKYWVPLERHEEIIFSTIPPGKYLLSIRKTAISEELDDSLHLVIIIRPAFWQTIWFKVLSLVAGVFAVYILFRIRARYLYHANSLLEKKVAEKTRQLKFINLSLRKSVDQQKKQLTTQKKLTQLISHDIRTPLRYLSIYIQNVEEDLDKKDPALNEAVQIIQQTIISLFDFVEQNIRHIKHKKNPEDNENPHYLITDLIQAKIRIFKVAAKLQKTKVILSVKNDLRTGVNSNFLSIIIHNLLDNALKNTINGKVNIYCYISNKYLTLEVTDTGRGMPSQEVGYYLRLFRGEEIVSEQQGIGLGLPMVIDLVLIMNGTMEIKSTPQRGTKITLRFPLP
ncbi:sensor histidine kinase [Belliella marina]|uniref:histidine kinase n=1 Tax=Belliella marina TaxID=1644146 RepID=A0ABW4VKT9_9BACT